MSSPRVGKKGKDSSTFNYSTGSLRDKSSEEELFELVQLSGVPITRRVFKVMYDLLKLNVAPSVILEMLQTMAEPKGEEGVAGPFDQQQ